MKPVELQLTVPPVSEGDRSDLEERLSGTCRRLLGDLSLGDLLAPSVVVDSDGAGLPWQPLRLSIDGRRTAVRLGELAPSCEMPDLVQRAEEGLFASRARLPQAAGLVEDASGAVASAITTLSERCIAARDVLEVVDEPVGTMEWRNALAIEGDRRLADRADIHLGSETWIDVCRAADVDPSSCEVLEGTDAGLLTDLSADFSETVALQGGFDVLPMRYVRDDELPEDDACVALNDLRLPSTPGIGSGRRFCSVLDDRLAAYGLLGEPWLDPVSFAAGSSIDADDAGVVSAIGGQTWSPPEFVLFAALRPLLRHVWTTFSISRVATALRAAASANGFEVQVGAALEIIGLERVCEVLRELARDLVRIGDVRAILDAAIRPLPGGLHGSVDDDVSRIRYHLRRSLMSTRTGQPLPAYLGDASFVEWLRSEPVTLERDLEIVDAIAAVHHPAIYHQFGRAVVLVPADVRRTVSEAIRTALPTAVVFATEELTWDADAVRIGTITAPS